MITLSTRVIPSAVLLDGCEDIVIGQTAKVKVQTTGDGAVVVFHDGPPRGKAWRVRVALVITETDEGT